MHSGTAQAKAEELLKKAETYLLPSVDTTAEQRTTYARVAEGLIRAAAVYARLAEIKS